MKLPIPIVRLLLAAALCLSAPAYSETVKVAMIDPFSGPFAVIQENVLHTFRVTEELARKEKDAGPFQLEFLPFDNKGSPQETIVQFKAAADQGIRYVYQAAGSGPSLPLLDAINKHNERNPGKEVVYLSWAGDPILTNERCSFWFFRLDQHNQMKAEALTTYLAKNANVKKLYLINQNYSSGQQFSAAVKEYLKRKRPDIQIVGDDLHPLGQVKDFSPYVAKIRASGADTIATSSFGADLALFVKSTKEAGLQTNIYTYFAATQGVPAAMGAAGADRVKVVTYWHPNTESAAGKQVVDILRDRFSEDLVFMPAHTLVTLLRKSLKDAKSSDPVKVAYAMEGMKFNTLSGEAEIRKSDHQIQQAMYIASWTKVNNKDVKYDQEKTGYGWKTEQKLEGYISSQLTSCDMKRPARP